MAPYIRETDTRAFDKGNNPVHTSATTVSNVQTSSDSLEPKNAQQWQLPSITATHTIQCENIILSVLIMTW